jgi:hypothetical protein
LIFATLGTHHQPFERLLHAAVAFAAGRELIVQHGHTPPLASPSSVSWRQWLTPQEMGVSMRAASVVITHAGVASVVDALHAGHYPVVLPRSGHLGGWCFSDQPRSASGEQGFPEVKSQAVVARRAGGPLYGAALVQNHSR